MARLKVNSQMNKFVGDTRHSAHILNIGVKPATYFSWTSGRRMPGKEFHSKIEESYGMPISVLFPDWINESDKVPDVRPCPFCRSEVKIEIEEYDPEDNLMVVHCMECEAWGPPGIDIAGAIKSWNIRRKKLG